MEENEKNTSRLTSVGFWVGIVIFILVAGCATYSFNRYKNKIETRAVLSDAKNAKIAMRLMAVEYYGKDQSILDGSRKSGLCEAAEKELWNLMDVTDCEIHVHEWDDEERTPKNFTFSEGKYMVVYDSSHKSEGQPVWSIYKLTSQFTSDN